MAKCSKCGFVIVTKLLAGHEFLCGGTVRETPDLPPFPPLPIVYKSDVDPYKSNTLIRHLMAERDAWESRCRRAVEALEIYAGRANYFSAQRALEAIGPLPERQL